MAALTKRRKLIQEHIQPGKVYQFDEAVEILKKIPAPKFRESVDVSINLGIDPRKSEQVVRGSVVMPHGTGKSVRVAVFAQGANADAAKQAGADIVGMNDLADAIKGGNFNFDVVIAAPDAMGVVGRLGPILGPKGLMPNPKVGTVAADVATAVKNAKSGQVMFKADKQGIVHCAFGKIDFSVQALKENLEFLLVGLKKAKPSSAKGVYLKKATIATTMGPGLIIDLSSLAH